jgi:type II secretory pathway pseudopilin PulG
MKIRGFTLIEGVLAVALLAAGLVGLLYVFQGAVVNALVADQSYVALNLAREAAETIIARRDCSLSGCGYADTLAAIQSNSYNASPVTGFTGYNLTVTALEVEPGTSPGPTNFTVASPGSGYARVTVTVTWNSGSNSIQLATLIANYT